MSRSALRLASVAALAVLPALLGCPAVGRPAIAVYPNAFNFGADKTADAFTVSNAGSGTLAWEVEDLPSWLQVSPVSGSIGGGSQLVTMTVDRTNLAPGEYAQEFTVTSSAGDEKVLARMVVAGTPAGPALAVTPAALDFGTQSTALGLTVRNDGDGTLEWSLAEDIPWLDVSAASGSVSGAGASAPLQVTVTRQGLAAGIHTGSISFMSNGGTAIVEVSVAAEGPSAALAVSPQSLAFGTTSTTALLTIANNGAAPLEWSLSESLDWLSLSQTSGTLNPGSVNVTVTVNRAALATGDYAGTINVASNGGSASVSVTCSVAHTQISVFPATLDFGPSTQNKLLAISNAGVGTVNWTIDTTGFPSWLSVSSASGSVTTSTSVTMVHVNRDTLPMGSYNHTFTVQSNAGSASVAVHMSVPARPVLTVRPTLLADPMNPILTTLRAELGAIDTTGRFYIANVGDGTLDWTIEPVSQQESWFTAWPMQGSVTTGAIAVNFSVDRTGLETKGYSQELLVRSNGGTATVVVTMQVEPTGAIGVDPISISLGVDGSTAQFSVANVGDPGTRLAFDIREDAPSGWLLFSPGSGESIGVSGPMKDWRSFSITVERSRLPVQGGTTSLYVQGTGRHGHLRSAPITVTALPVPLAFEAAQARVRIPSLVRHVFLMRDVRDQAILASPVDLADVFRISEKSIPLEVAETNQFVSGPEKLRGNLAILLDYSGSMKAAADSRPGSVSLHDTYTSVVRDFIEAVPAHWRLALLEFHDRRQPVRVLADFTRDREAIVDEMTRFRLDDYGATELLPALYETMGLLAAADAPFLDFDNADIRAVAVITDGRMTSPPGELDKAIPDFQDGRMRIFPVGWGQSVDQEPLARLALKTGGHYYPALRVGSDAVSTEALEEQSARLASDLRAHIALSYVTLREDDSVSVRVSGTYDDDPTDARPPAQGSFAQDLDFAGIAGDVRLGQLSMHSEGIVEGSDGTREAKVYIRADYMPRNIRSFIFDIVATRNFTFRAVPNDAGGIVGHWPQPFRRPVDQRIQIAAPTGGDPLQYGAFGDILELTFTEVTEDSIGVSLVVDESIYAGDADPKRFIYPDYIVVGERPAQAPAFPTPMVTPTFVEIGPGQDTGTFTIRNMGGAFPQGAPSIRLAWELELPSDGWLSVDPASGALGSATVEQEVVLTVDREDLAPGVYQTIVPISFDTGSMLPVYSPMFVVVRMTVPAPAPVPTPE